MIRDTAVIAFVVFVVAVEACGLLDDWRWDKHVRTIRSRREGRS
jgi:hypothetical protein